MPKALVLVGTNSIGKLKKYRDERYTYDSGMLWVNESGKIWLSSPRRAVGRLPQPLRGGDFIQWLRDNNIHIDKVYSEPETVFQLQVKIYVNRQENALIQGIMAHCNLK